MSAKKKRLTNVALTAVFAALLCVISPITLPLGAVPFTLSVFAVCCISIITEEKAPLSTVLYILIGAAGLPVFAGFAGGIGVLAGATGGFIFGYIPFAFITGIGARKRNKARYDFLFSLLGLVSCYICGCAWYFITTGADFMQGLTVCVFPFIIPDMIKIAAGVLCGRKIKSILQRSR